MTTHMNRLTVMALVGALIFGACNIEDLDDPNAPSINSISEGATLTQLNLLVSGLEAEAREGYELYVTSTGTVAREIYRFDADPRNTADLLNGNIDNNTFYITNPYGNAYGVVKTANLLIDAVANTQSVSDAEKSGYNGVANTFKAYALQRVADMLGSNGIRVDVGDPNNLGPFLSEADALAAIEEIYDLGFSQLQAGEFAFSFSDGYEGFNDPANFASFNRALAARNNLQQRDWAGALANVDNSFFVSGDMPDLGPQFVFSTSSGDFLNPLFRIPGNTGNMIFAHPSWVAEADPNDNRLSQISTRLKADGVTLDTFVRDGLNGIFETRKFASSTAPIRIIDNAELHLIRAEALSQTPGSEADAVVLIDIIRGLAGLTNYTGAQTSSALVDEILTQRRYLLWQTGLRFSDLRRYNRLNDMFLPLDRPDDVISPEFPVPLSEGL